MLRSTLLFLTLTLPASGLPQTDSVTKTSPLDEKATSEPVASQLQTSTISLRETKNFQDANGASSIFYTDAEIGRKRQLFRDAIEALKNNKHKTYQKLARQLDNYPLRPYLEYRYLLTQPGQINTSRLQKLETTHDAERLARYLRKVRLRRLVTANETNQLVNEYREAAADDDVSCAYINKMFRLKRESEILDHALSLWSNPRSMPDACDYPFEKLIVSGQISDDLARKRYLGARKKSEKTLANYLFRFLSEEDKQKADLLERIEKSPLDLDDYKAPLIQVLANDRSAEWVESFFKAAKPYFRKSFDKSARLLKNIVATDSSSQRISVQQNSDEKSAIQQFVDNSRDYLLTRAALADLSTYPRYFSKLGSPGTTVALEWQARALIQNAQWRKLRDLIERFPGEMRLEKRWRYWDLRAAQLGGKLTAEQREAVSLLAEETGFYGFAAAKALDKPFVIRADWYDVSDTDRRKLLANKKIARAIEFYLQNIQSHANADWQDALKAMDKEQIRAAAYLASEIGWHNQAIATAAKAKIWSHYHIRFPDFAKQSFADQSLRYRVPDEWLYATARQESALNPAARSSANARGLMQLLPATARQTAKGVGKVYQEALLDSSEYNIALGSAYLAKMYYRFGNKALASAAYNAGPHRVDKWLKNLDREIPVDAWIETIRFRETRQYVQNVLSFGLIKNALALSATDHKNPRQTPLQYQFISSSEALVKPYARQVDTNISY